MIKVSPLLVDSITIPTGSDGKQACECVRSLDFDPDSFDYTLWTDGSGHSDGYGAYAAIWKCADGDMDMSFGANYGQTVNRNELIAMIEGLTAILSDRVVKMRGVLEMNPKNELAALNDADRVTVAWHTDRQNLAVSLLWNDAGEPVFRRNSDRDLWARFSFLAKHACVVPYHSPRNVVAQQGMCDEVCTLMREAIKKMDGEVKLASLKTDVKWIQRKQSAVI